MSDDTIDGETRVLARAILHYLEKRPEAKDTLDYTTRDGLPSDEVVRLYEDRGGNIWVGTATGTFVYWSRSGQKFIGIAADWVRSYASAFGEDKAGHVWIGR